MLNFNPQDFELVRFFSYTSTIPHAKDTISVDTWRTLYPNIRERLDIFFGEIRQMAVELSKEKTGKPMENFFIDNKTVYQILDKKTRKYYFIGKYDSTYRIGSSCILFGGYVFDFKKMVRTGYVEEIMCNGFDLWKRYEIK